MKVLVTGSRGLVGSGIAVALERDGDEVVGFDRLDGRDVLDESSLREAASGCDGIVHAAALLGRPGESAGQILSVNVQGTWNVLSAAIEARVPRVVFVSSVDALGLFKGERAPDYLPLDDAHPCYPTTPYGISKRLGEEMCRLVAASGAPSVVCLRTPGVWTTATYGWIDAQRAKRPEFEWDPFWEYGAFIDVRDLASCCAAALRCPTDGFHCLLVASSDLTTSGRTSRELAELVHPDVEWRGGEKYVDAPYATLLDIDPARRLLDWNPAHTWRAHERSR